MIIIDRRHDNLTLAFKSKIMLRLFTSERNSPRFPEIRFQLQKVNAKFPRARQQEIF